jgi:hypothetical protein
MPPPRHPVPVGNAEPAQSQPDQPGAVSAAEVESVQNADQEFVTPATSTIRSTTRPEKPAPRSTARPKSEDAKAVGEEAPPRPATLYLDNNLLEFLEEARIAGLVSRPRLDISKSAVVRLALRRLQQDMTIDEIREHLRSQPTDPTKTGRKRR